MSSQLTVRVEPEVKHELEVLAASQGKQLADFVRENFDRLLLERKIKVVEGDSGSSSIRVPYYPSYPQAPLVPMYPTPQYPSPGYHPGYPGYPPGPPPDAMDEMVKSMQKLVIFKVMAGMIRDNVPPEALINYAKAGSKGDDIDIGQMMKYQMLQSQLERQLEMARSHGDKGGENKILEYMMALSTAQMGQSQQFLNQFATMGAASSQAQQALFNTALQTSNQSSQESRNQANVFNERIEKIRGDLQTNQLNSMQKINEIQLNNLTLEIQRVRTEGSKDPLTQLANLIKMRDESPVYRAAFDAAFGVKNEGMLSALLPILKELGAEKVAATVMDALGKIFRPQPTPMIPPPAAIPPPLSITKPTDKTFEELTALTLPPPGTTVGPTVVPAPAAPAAPPPTKPLTQKALEQQFTVPESESVGYTNINRPQDLVTIQKPTEKPTDMIITTLPSENPQA